MPFASLRQGEERHYATGSGAYLSHVWVYVSALAVLQSPEVHSPKVSWGGAWPSVFEVTQFDSDVLPLSRLT